MIKFAIAVLLGLTSSVASFGAEPGEAVRSQPVTTLRLEPAAPAEPSDATKIQSLIGLLNQELEATMRQLRLLQELRESNIRSAGFAQQMSTSVLSIDDVNAAKNAAQRRDQELVAEMDRLYQRIGQIGEQKRGLLGKAVEMLTPK